MNTGATPIRPLFRPSRSRLAGRRLSNLWWERRLGISTRGIVPVEHPDSVHYSTISYANIFSILNHLALGPSDVFVDIGSGKGRVLCCAARYPVERVLGVDLSESLCEAARENARRLRGRRAPISVQASTADHFDYSTATVLFLFDPFGASTLAPLLEKIAGEARASVRIAYVNPTHDDVFQQQQWLEHYGRWDSAAPGNEHSVSFYRTRSRPAIDARAVGG
jgi:precorrin-6B methylase 2